MIIWIGFCAKFKTNGPQSVPSRGFYHFSYKCMVRRRKGAVVSSIEVFRGLAWARLLFHPSHYQWILWIYFPVSLVHGAYFRELRAHWLGFWTFWIISFGLDLLHRWAEVALFWLSAFFLVSIRRCYDQRTTSDSVRFYFAPSTLNSSSNEGQFS